MIIGAPPKKNGVGGGGRRNAQKRCKNIDYLATMRKIGRAKKTIVKRINSHHFLVQRTDCPPILAAIPPVPRQVQPGTRPRMHSWTCTCMSVHACACVCVWVHFGIYLEVVDLAIFTGEVLPLACEPMGRCVGGWVDSGDTLHSFYCWLNGWLGVITG